jgi:arsenate reductase-like glutaredoxin family protein
VAPKRRKEAEGLSGDALLKWLSEDGARIRRPIIEIGEMLTLGFTAETRSKLDEAL